ncbi:MAG: RNA methyltransferase [Firmicutes bacterium]|nr:RNA methyltransferase [Bacillota bacterium]
MRSGLRFQEIHSSSNFHIKEYRRLASSRKQRRHAGRLALEGPLLLEEALAAGLHPEVVFATRRYLDEGGPGLLAALPGKCRGYLLPPALFARLADTETPQEIAAIFPFRELEQAGSLAGELSLVIFLDRLQDPGNLGTIIRTAAAAGVDAIFYGPGSVDPYSPKALRSSAGAVFRLPPVEAAAPLQLLRELQDRKMAVLAARPREGRNFWEIDFRKKTALLIGSESRGLSPELIAVADRQVHIPQFSAVDSLNAAVAAAVLIYEARRQRTPL